MTCYYVPHERYIVLPKEERQELCMMYLKLNADYKQGELVPLLDDAIYVYCDVCKSLHRIEDVSHAAFGSCSFEQLNVD